MELRQYWTIIQRRWWLPATIGLVALVASGLVALAGANAYKTEMRLAVSTVPTAPAADTWYDPVYYSNLDSEYFADDLTEFLTSKAFADEVSAELKAAIPSSTISDVTRARKTHRFIDVTLSTSTFAQGQEVAGSITRILADPNHLAQYLRALNAYQTNVTVVTPPSTRRASSIAGIVSDVGLRTVIGLIIGLALALLLNYLDRSIRDRADVEQSVGLSVLGEIPAKARGARTAA